MKERGFVLHRPGRHLGARARRWRARTSRSPCRAISSTRSSRGAARATFSSPSATRGGARGQLENEVLQNAWLSGPADLDLVFEAPFEDRWELAARGLGIEMHRLSGQSGRA